MYNTSDFIFESLAHFIESLFFIKFIFKDDISLKSLGFRILTVSAELGILTSYSLDLISFQSPPVKTWLP